MRNLLFVAAAGDLGRFTVPVMENAISGPVAAR